MVAGVGLVLVTVLLGVIFVIGRGSDVQHSFGEAAQNSQDWEWRMSGWTSLLRTHFSDPASILIGEPEGAGLGRYINGQYVDVIAHNEYLQLGIRIGAPGLLCFLGLFASSLWTISLASKKHASLLHPGPNFWRIWIFMTFAYFVAYSPTYDQSLLLGMTISLTTMVSSQATLDELKANLWRPHLRGVFSPSNARLSRNSTAGPD
jgi:hypothetical protein